MEKVKFHVYWWLKANNASFVYGCDRSGGRALCIVWISANVSSCKYLSDSLFLSVLFNTPGV